MRSGEGHPSAADPSGRPRVAFVIHRFGPGVVGGAERLACELAQRLSRDWSLDVLTTCALDYRHWKNETAAGRFQSDGYEVVRFPVARRRHWRLFGRLSSLVYRLHRRGWMTTWLESFWVLAQGPVVPGLIEYIRENRSNYKAFVFFGYLYYPTVRGLPLVAERSVLVPTAHDEPQIHFPGYRELLGRPALRLYLSEVEAGLVKSLIGEKAEPSALTGFGIQLPPLTAEEPGDFFLYAGRIERGKGCEELFRFALRSGTRLKVIGPAQIQIPRGIDYCGVVSEDEKNRLIAACRALIIPSRLESLSIVALEAMAAGKAVIVSRRSPVLMRLVTRSGGGYGYDGFEEFRWIVTQADMEVGQLGRRWVELHHSWDQVLPRYRRAIEGVFRRQSSG